MQPKTTLEVLREARELLSDPAKWTKRGEHGPRYCTVSAVTEVSGGRADDRATRALYDALPSRWAGQYVHSFNDDPSTTHADVLALFDRAIAAEVAKVGS